MRRTQRGLGWFGSLVVLALAAGAGYYLYQQMVVDEQAPSCAAQHNACLQDCRRSATDNASIQACQERCRREAAHCEALTR